MHWFRHPHIEVLARYPSGLLLQSDSNVHTHDRVEAEIDGVTLDLTLNHVERIDDDSRPWLEALEGLRARNHQPVRKYIYRGELQEPREALPHLYVLLEPAPTPHKEDRDHPRFDHRLKVRSATLPGYEGLIYDISLSGLRMDLHEEAQRGSQFGLELHLDHESALPIKLNVEVRWVRKVGREYETGVRFVDLDEEQKRRLAAFVATLGKTEAGLQVDRS